MSLISTKIADFKGKLTLRELDNALSDSLAELDCGDFTYNYYSPDFNKTHQPLHVVSTQEVQGWQEYYTSHHYDQIDPIMRRMRSSHCPLGWVLSDELASGPESQSQVLKDAMEFGFEGGFAVPIHTSQGGFANLVMQNIAILNVIKKHPEVEHNLQLIAHYYHAQVAHLLAMQNKTATEVKLTLREMDCLRLTAQHKTAKEIARILNITPRTVSFHIENSLKKLEVTNKHQAVSRARQLFDFF